MPRPKCATGPSPRPALGDREAVPALISASETPESRFEAGLALAALPDVRALQVYLRGLTDKNTDLRKASATAIGSIRDQAATVLDQLAAQGAAGRSRSRAAIDLYLPRSDHEVGRAGPIRVRPAASSSGGPTGGFEGELERF